MKIEHKLDLQIEWGKKVVISLIGKSGEKLDIEVKKPKTVSEKISDKELVALNVMRLILPQVFPEETTGVDQAGFQVEREEVVINLPGKRELDYREALSWSGAVLQGKGWSVDRITKVLLEEAPKEVRASFKTGSIGSDSQELIKARIRREITKYYPGAAASYRRRAIKPNDW